MKGNKASIHFQNVQLMCLDPGEPVCFDLSERDRSFRLDVAVPRL